jgi:phosphoribosylamine-glycine ligase
MNILILGGGGREHALAWAVLQNPKCDRLIVAPGNAGIAKSRNVRILIFSTMRPFLHSAKKTTFLS